jgi:metal-sulfur cluster biosynthetic enzyme
VSTTQQPPSDLKPPRPAQRGEVAEHREAGEGCPVSQPKDPGLPPGGGTPSQTLEALVWQELRECYDPEIPINIVELGLVYAVRTRALPEGGHRVEVVMTVTSPACGMSEILRDEADARIRRLPDVREVEVAVTFDPPWTPELMTDEARTLLNL